MWRRYLKVAQGYTAAHPDGIVSYTAHELRHVCASLLIASGASDVQVAHQVGHSKIETTKKPTRTRNQERATATMQLPDTPIEVASPTDCRAGNLVFLGLNGSDLGGGTRT